jgi:hypothetical protein
MGVPFLDAHEALPGFFWLSAGLAPISIRDQIVRGTSVIDHAFEEGLIQEGELVMVVGAGAAGVTAIVRAAEKHINTILVDRARGPFLVQARASTRWVDPTQYDWPLEHWSMRRYPWQPPRVPLSWKADWAPLISAAWHIQLRSLISTHHPYLRFRYSSRVALIKPPSSSGTSFIVQLTNGESFHPKMLVWTTGFGREDCKIPGGSFAGLPFWTTDPFTITGLGTGQSKPAVVIAGAGDGGLQDYLRICTRCKSAEEIYRRVILGTPLERPVMIFLKDMEDLAHRSWVWSGSRKRDHVIHAMLHRHHKRAALALLRDPAVFANLNQLIPDLPCEPVLVYRCSHFTNFYALNRLLVLLISGFLLKRFKVHTLVPRHSLLAVTSAAAAHRCDPRRPRACLPHKHYVELASDPDCRAKPGAAKSPRWLVDLVVIRYGVDASGAAPPLMPNPAAKLQRTRHSIPYHIIA